MAWSINARSSRFTKLWCDAGFKTTFIAHCRAHHISAEVVNRIHAHEFVVLPQRWIVERTWSWLMNNRRLQIDYERDPVVTGGRRMGRALTPPPPPTHHPGDTVTTRDRAAQTFATAS